MNNDYEILWAQDFSEKFITVSAIVLIECDKKIILSLPKKDI